MTVDTRITTHLASLPDATRVAMQSLHEHVVRLLPDAKRWFLDGTDDTGRVVSNPSIGHGSYRITYADGRSREFYQVGLSATTRGLSVYLMGLTDRTYLACTYGATIGKATVTGYCISFRRLEQIELAVLDAAILDVVSRTSD